MSPTAAPRVESHVDVLVIGAGLAGVGAAAHLRARCPDHTVAVLEARDAVGGTWDLFRYPGVRSDSDMFTLGYNFRPWREPHAIAGGAAIRRYIEETAAECGVDRLIRFGHRVVRAEWSSAAARWAVDVEVGAERRPARLTCGFLYACTGYYDYAAGHAPAWPGMDGFRGRVVHPQHWPEDLDYADKRVVVIGSGATAVTLVPAMAERAAHVTMLQRSPTYVAAQPARDRVADGLRRVLPAGAAHGLARWKNVLRAMFFYTLARRRPALMKRLLRWGVRRELGPAYDVDTHFAPRYDPWDERLCVAPDGDFFRAVRGGRASVVTDHVEAFDGGGLRLRSGARLNADVVVTATGLAVRLMGGIPLVVDGAPVDLTRTVAYKGLMYSGVPNLAAAFGYTNASWTLKCDLAAAYVCRLLNHMARRGYAQCTPRAPGPDVALAPVLELSAGYVQRALPALPRQGTRAPWRMHQNYLRDLAALRYGRVDDAAIEFRQAG